MKVAICTPTMGSVKTGYVNSLVGVLGTTRAAGMLFYATIDTVIITARNALVASAKQAGVDHILWVDSDQTFPPETLEALLSHKLPFVACNVARRVPPYTPTAFSGGGTVWTTPEKAQEKLLEPVDSIGLGVALTSMDLFRDTDTPFDHDPAGEDISFCRSMAGRGIRPHIDHALSWKIGHVGEATITHAHALKERRGNVASPVFTSFWPQ